MAKAAKANQEMIDKCRIVTPEFRVSYPHVFKAAQVNGKGDPKYSITMLFKKTDDLGPIKNAIKNAKVVAFGPDKESWPKGLASPVSDGDDAKYADKEGYKGHWVVKAISNEQSKPGVVDEECEPIMDAGDFYPGCYARAQVFCRVWEFSGKQGIHFILDHVQKTDDGKKLSTKKDASEVFGRVNKKKAAPDADEEESEDEESFA